MASAAFGCKTVVAVRLVMKLSENSMYIHHETLLVLNDCNTDFTGSQSSGQFFFVQPVQGEIETVHVTYILYYGMGY